jgi:hypothetical protein
MACYVYVFPCAWEDHCKVGFSGNPLSRLRQLHRRWFEFFDLERGCLVETETVRDARDVELALKRKLSAHNAPAPLTVRREAAGHTEWFRGASATLDELLAARARHGHALHPLRSWVREALLARSDQLYDWSLAQLAVDELDGLCDGSPGQTLVRDELDGYRSLGIDVRPLLSPRVAGWFAARTG